MLRCLRCLELTSVHDQACSCETFVVRDSEGSLLKEVSHEMLVKIVKEVSHAVLKVVCHVGEPLRILCSELASLQCKCSSAQMCAE